MGQRKHRAGGRGRWAAWVAALAVAAAGVTWAGVDTPAQAAPNCNVPNPPPICENDPEEPPTTPKPKPKPTVSPDSPLRPWTPVVRGIPQPLLPAVALNVTHAGGPQGTGTAIQVAYGLPGAAQNWINLPTGGLGGTRIPAPNPTIWENVPEYAVSSEVQCIRVAVYNDYGQSPWWTGCTRRSPEVTDIRWNQTSTNGGTLSWIDNSPYDVTYKVAYGVAPAGTLLSLTTPQLSTAGDGAPTGRRVSVSINGLPFVSDREIMVRVWAIAEDHADSWLEAPVLDAKEASFALGIPV